LSSRSRHARPQFWAWLIGHACHCSERELARVSLAPSHVMLYNQMLLENFCMNHAPIKRMLF
jgi:hypothetical protein